MKTVLIVDDMKTQLDLMNRYLDEAGYKVLTASDAIEALNKVSEHQPDVIITDLVMPDMSGLEFCRKLKKDSATANIPVIACSTKNRSMDQKWAMKQGVAAYVVKPYSKEEIVEAVKGLIN